MTFSLRAALPGDAQELKRLNEDFNGTGKQTVENMAKSIAENSSELVFVAQNGDCLAGFCCCQIKRSFCYERISAELTEMYVDPKFRRQGVGKALVELAISWCKENNCEALTLLTGGDNTAAQCFYEAMGFTLSGEVHYEKELCSPREI